MCLTFLVKHILFIVNLIFVIIALAIISVGSYALYYVNNNDVLKNITSEEIAVVPNEVNNDVIQYICIAIIVVGAAIFLTSFCGCCGSISENRCLLIMYAIVMFLFIGLSIFLFITSNNIFKKAENFLGDNVNQTFYLAEDPIRNETIHAIQYSLKCCGPHGPLDDYYNEQNVGFIDDLLDLLEIFENKLNISGIGYVSPSCCSTFEPRAFIDNPEEYIQDVFVCTADDVYMEGCVDKILGYIGLAARYFNYVIGGIAAVEVVAFIFAVYMCCVISSKNKKRRRGY